MSAADLEAPAPDQGFVTKHSTSAPKVYAFKEEVPEDVSKHLSQQTEWAVKLLETLTKDNSEDGMPSGVLNACEGLAFINCAKGGFGVTWAKGDGFVIRKLESDRFAHSLWSAPVFFKVSQVGFGVAAGYERVDSALALMNIGSINRFAARQTLAGTDLGLFSTSAAVSGMPAGTFGGGQHLDIAADRETSVFAYSTSSGVLVNISINGTDVQPDTHWNDKLHGPGANLEAVLSGEGVTYKELLPLYRKVQELAQRALGQ